MGCLTYNRTAFGTADGEVSELVGHRFDLTIGGSGWCGKLGIGEHWRVVEAHHIDTGEGTGDKLLNQLCGYYKHLKIYFTKSN